jgi:hypothetical protein
MRAVLIIGVILGASTAMADSHDDIQPCELRFLEPPDERGAVVANLWPSGVIPYDFDSAVSSLNRSRMRSGMNTMENAAGVHFVERTSESSFLHIGAYGGNWSYAGQIGGSQDLSIYNWSEHYIICHELMHAMGRFHQHSRTDRNSYITVNYDNIDADCQSQYNINGGTNYVEYDFDSLMHYGQWDCSIGGQTMTCKPGYEGWQNQMGQRSHLSSGDIETVSIMYPEFDPDMRVMYNSLGSDELEPGEQTSLLSVTRNIGEGVALDLNIEIRLSSDDTITDADTLLGSEPVGYVLAGDFYYLNADILIPSGTADGVWYVGVKATAEGDSNQSNDVIVTEIQVGELQPCAGDVNGDGIVSVDDLLAVIGAWGDCQGCDEDSNGDDVVGVDDVLIILSAWGDCL